MIKTKLTFLLLIFMLNISAQQLAGEIAFTSNNKELNEAFDWAKKKALSLAHDGSDPVGYWYEAALPNREAFCMRDVSHQAIGAELLGLSDHNLNMFLKFAQNIGKEKDYCSYWEINRYDKPAPVDYENDKDFWYNLPANFDVIYNAHRLYEWTGNKEYMQNEDLLRFYDLSMNEYVEHWHLGNDKVRERERDMHLVKPEKGKWRFGNKRGIPTYNEGGRGETHLGIDMTASLVAAYNAYAEILRFNDHNHRADLMNERARKEQQFLNEFWWDNVKGKYKSILYADGSFDYFMVGSNQAFQHYVLYFNALSDKDKIKAMVDDYVANYEKLIVELKSYLPIIFYENGYSDIANKMVVELCSPANKRRDYPENSYTVIEHVARGLMGIETNVKHRIVSTFSRLENTNDWAELKNVPVLGGKITVKHEGYSKSTFTNNGTSEVFWCPVLKEGGPIVYVNGKRTQALKMKNSGAFSVVAIEVQPGETAVISK